METHERSQDSPLPRGFAERAEGFVGEAGCRVQTLSLGEDDRPRIPVWARRIAPAARPVTPVVRELTQDDGQEEFVSAFDDVKCTRFSVFHPGAHLDVARPMVEVM